MKVFWLVCLTLFALVAAQNDHLAEQRTALNLQPVALGTTYHSELAAAVTSQSIQGSNCEFYVHPVTNVRAPESNERGSFSISVDLSTTLSGGILITLMNTNGSVIPFSEVRGTSASSVNDYTVRCTASGCIIDYYCPSTFQNLIVEISTDCTAGTVETTTVYSITFTEYVEIIQTIPASRTLALTSGTIVSYSPNNHGTKNFVQFFHNLVPTVPETNAASRLVIQATLSNSASSFICYSYEGISITRVNTASPSSEGGSITDDFCNEIICRQTSGSVITIEIPACSVACDLNTNLWIGVGQTNVANTFSTAINVTLFYNTDVVKLPSVTQINSMKWETEGFLTNEARCDIESGDFTCANFYSFTLGSIGFNTANINRDISPLIKVTLYGVFNGEVDMDIQRNAISGFGLLECDCELLSTCTVSDGFTDVNECTISITPCDWTTALTDEWVISLSSTNPAQYSSLYPTTYGLRFEATSYSLTNVPVSSWITPYRSSIKIEDVHIYKFDFTESDISRDSILIAEFFTDLAEEDIVFGWNYELDTCNEPEGHCNPHGTTNGDSHAFNSCRFFFTPCEGSSPDANGFYGDIRGVLKPGSLYFYVYFFDFDIKTPYRAFGRTVDYTIRFHLRNASPIYEGKTNVLTVYNEELSPQYYVDVPNDETIARVRVIVSNTFGGKITSYLNINDFAGDCVDCFTYFDYCSSRTFSFLDLPVDGYFNGPEDMLFDCEILLPGCSVQGQRIYIASKFDDGGFPFRPDNDHEDDPIGYTLTVHFDYVSEPQSIEASRVGAEIIGEIGKGAQTIESSLNLYPFNQGFLDFENTRFFKLDLTNANLKSSDVLRFALSFTTVFQNQYRTVNIDDYYQYYSSNFIGLAVSDIGYSYDWLREEFSSDFCNIEARTCLASTNTAFYYNPEFFGDIVDSDKFSECSIVIQSCDAQGTLCNANNKGLSGVYYITVQNFPEILNAYADFQETDSSVFTTDVNDVTFNLKAQIVSQEPIPLSDNVPITGSLETDVYVHFKFDVPTQVVANSWLRTNFYFDTDSFAEVAFSDGGVVSRYPTIYYYMHYVAAGESVVKAGKSENCFESDFCEPCMTDPWNPECYYQISPCEYRKSAGGSYYISVHTDYVKFFNEEVYFTLNVKTENIVELLVAPTYAPVSSFVFENTANYYSLSVPALPANTAGWVLSVKIAPVHVGEIYVSLNKIAPGNNCECADVAELVTDPVWLRYYPCEITPGTVYYLKVEGEENVNSVLPVSYSVHARLIPVEIRTVNLIAGTAPIVQTFDGSLSLNWNQFVTYQFTVNAIAGTQIAVEVDSNDNTDDFNVYLSTGRLATSSGSIGGLSNDYIYASTEECDGSISSCNSVSSCDLVARACSVSDSTNQVWYLTFTGENLVPLHSSGNITFNIRVINPSNTFTFPTSTTGSTSNSFTVENTVNRAFGVSNYVSTGFTSLAAGNSLRFTLSGSGATCYIRYATETGSDCSSDCQLTSGQSCEIFACSTVSGGVWYFSFENANGALDISLSTVSYGNTNVQTIQSSSTPFNIPTIESNNWQYYQVSGPANTAGQWDLVINPSGSVYTITGTPFLFPGFFPSTASYAKGITPSGVVDSCGVAVAGGNDGGSCCYPAFTKIFAVQPSSTLTSGTIDFEIVNYVRNAFSQTGASWNTTNSLTADFIDTIQFSVAPGSGFWVEFRTNDSASIYLNRGSRAGSDGDASYARCWDNFASTQQLCGSNAVTNSVCRAFIDNCYDCVGSNVNSNYFITILALNSVTYSVSFVQQSDNVLTTPQGSQTLFFPSSQIILDPRSYQSTSNNLYTHFTFAYSRLLSDNIVNFVPYRSDLPGLAFPNVRFIMNQIRRVGSPDNIVGTSPLVLFVNSLGSGCARGGQVSVNAGLCLESGQGVYDSVTGAFNCSVSVCDLSCSGLYWSVGRATDDAQETRYQFNFQSTEVYSGIAEAQPAINIIDINLSTPGSSVRNSVDAGVSRITYYRVRVGSSFALAGVKNYPSIEFSFGSATGSLSLGSYDAQCFASLQTDVTGLTGNSAYIYHYDPMDFEDTYGNSVNSVFYIRAEVSSGSGTYSLNATWAINTVQVISANVNAASPYSATKEISDFQWQFFEFTTPLTGYDTLRIEVDNLCCASNSAELDVYYSIGESVDIARPRRYPTEETYITSDVTDSVESISYTCDFYGGIYRVSVYAPEGTQLDDAYPAIYDISATVTSIQPRRLAVGCSYSFVSGNYFELEPEANNRGSELIINAEGSYTTFRVSRGSRPYDGSRCEWDDSDFDYDGTLSGVVEISECEYDDKWFIYIEYTEGSEITLSSAFYRKYIPTVSSPSFTTTANLHQNGIQYYKVVVPDGPLRAFRASILQCDGGEDLHMTVKRGNLGFSGYGSYVYEDSCTDGSSCYDLDCSVSYSNGISSCGIYDQYVCEGDLVYFIGIFASSGCSVTYTLDVTTDFMDEVLPVYLDVSTCHSVDCYSYFQVFNADGTKPDTTFSTVSVTIHNPSVASLEIGVSTKNNVLPSSSSCANCADEWLTCTSEICTYELCSYGGDILMLVSTVNPASLNSFEICEECPAEISILVEILSKVSVVPLSVGAAPSTASYSSYTLSPTGQSVEIISGTASYSENSFCESLPGCKYLFPSQDTTTYYFYEAGVQLASPVVNPLSTTFNTFTLRGNYIHFSYTPSTGRKFKSLEFSDFDYRAIESVDLYIHYSTQYVPYDYCDGCTNGDLLSWTSCSISYSPSVCYAGTVYFSICVDELPAHCDVSFKVRVIEEDVVQLGSTHLDSNFRSVSQSADSDLCVSAPASYSYFVDVTGPLFIGVREAVGADLVVYLKNSYCDGVDSCATDDNVDDISSCTIHNCDHCWAPGRYEVTVDVSPYEKGYSFDIIAITQYIPLTSSVQTTIGRLQHLYSYTATSIQSLVFTLDVITGPAVEISIFEGCNDAFAENYGFHESVVCAFGSCNVYVPTRAKRSPATAFYIHITSSTNNNWPAFIERNDASSSVKETQYSLSVSAGTSNCVAASSIISEAEFCGSVFRTISGVSLWSFEDVKLKDEEAECMYNSIAKELTCPLASAQCLDWLKTLSCLIVFPQCDSDGFQTGVCRDVCSVVDQQCGEAWEKATGCSQYDCHSDFYVGANISSTCYPIPPPPPPPSSVDDYRPVSAGPAVLDPFDVPVFSDVIIYLTTGQFNSISNIVQPTNSRTTVTRSEITSLFSSDFFGSASVVVPRDRKSVV